jgi:fumarate reductase flavoprotein subunit
MSARPGESPEPYDVIVVGAGMAGSTAAAVTAQAGLRVLVVDAAEDPSGGGNTAFGGGGMHVGRAELRSDPALLRDRMLGRALGEVQSGLVDAIAESAGAAMTWLLDQGVELMAEAPGDIESMLAPARHLTDVDAWHGRGPQRALRTLQTRAAEAGAAVRAHTEVSDLVFDARGAITGVCTTEGETLAAQAVVLCDGGFQLDRELVGRFLTPAPDALFLRCARTGGGAGLRMAGSAGARLVNMEWFYGHCLHADVFGNDRLWPWPALDEALTDGALLVGPDGRRVVDEGRGGVHAANVVARLDDPLSTWVVLDEGLWGKSRGDEQVWGHLAANPEFERRGGRIERADGAQALAGAIGVDANGLVATLEEYSAAAEAGTSTALAIPRTGVAQVTRDGLVAFPLAVGLSHTTGGPAIDGEGRVLGEDGNAVPRLFAAGAGAAAPSGGYFGGYAVALAIAWRCGRALARELPASAGYGHRAAAGKRMLCR